MGGQHIARAIWLMHNYYAREVGVAEDKIPRVYCKLSAEVVRLRASLDVRRQLAGDHQARQHDAHQASSSDNIAAFYRACKDKRGRLKTPLLTDNDVWTVIKSLGLDRENAFEEFKRKKPNESEANLRVKLVCNC